MLAELARQNVNVRGLVWRSHPDRPHFSEEENLHLVETVNEAGGEVLLDERVVETAATTRSCSSSATRTRPILDVAFVGGIDLCHGRNDDASATAATRRRSTSIRRVRATAPVARRPARGPRPRGRGPGLDVPGAMGGPDAARPPQSGGRRRLTERGEGTPPPAPAAADAGRPGPAGHHAVQTLRTYPAASGPRPTRSPRTASAASPAPTSRPSSGPDASCTWRTSTCGPARRRELPGRPLCDREPALHLVAVVPRYPDRTAASRGPPYRIGQQRGDRPAAPRGTATGSAFFDLETASGWPIYVHAKVCVVDDVWMIVGSDNLNLRSWTNDSELSCAVIDERTDDPRSRPILAASATARGGWPGRRGCGCGASTSGASDGDDADLVDGVGGHRACCGRRRRTSTPGTTAAGRRGRLAVSVTTGPARSVGGRSGGRRRCTGCSSILTAGHVR